MAAAVRRAKSLSKRSIETVGWIFVLAMMLLVLAEVFG